jgi:hypothetical protein
VALRSASVMTQKRVPFSATCGTVEERDVGPSWPSSRSRPTRSYVPFAPPFAPPLHRDDFGTASVLKNGRVVFNIAGNKYRLAVWINFPYRVVYIRFIGTHAQYDRVDAQTV